jgi:hypothetical protein
VINIEDVINIEVAINIEDVINIEDAIQVQLIGTRGTRIIMMENGEDVMNEGKARQIQ